MVREKLLRSRLASPLPSHHRSHGDVGDGSGDMNRDGAIDDFKDDEDDDLAGRDGGHDVDDDDGEELHDVLLLLLLVTKHLSGSSVFSRCSAFTLNLEWDLVGESLLNIPSWNKPFLLRQPEV